MASNIDAAPRCNRCGSNLFKTSQAAGPRPQSSSAPHPSTLRLSFRSVLVLLALCILGLAGEAGWRQIRLNRLEAALAAERTQAVADHANTVAQQRVADARLGQLERDQRLRLTNPALLSGALARERHRKEWALRVAHDPSLAMTVLETNLLTMERLGQDASLASQSALEKVALMAAPRDSRVDVEPEGDGFRVRVAFMMSRLSRNESGAVTKFYSTAAMRVEIQELSSRVMRDLYDFCGSRGIKSISVTCDHTLSLAPTNATPEERLDLLKRLPPAMVRLYRVSLDQSHARAIADWRQVSLGTVTQLSSVEYDGLTSLTIFVGSPRQDTRDAVGPLQF